MNCLVCGHDNRAGEESCVSCSASLRLKVCTCEAIIPQEAERCHNCGTKESVPSAWVISGEPRSLRRELRAALLAVPVLALAAFAAYQFSSAVPEAQAVPAAPPPGPVVEAKIIEAPRALSAPRVTPRVTHTRGDSASSGGATGLAVQ